MYSQWDNVEVWELMSLEDSEIPSITNKWESEKLHYHAPLLIKYETDRGRLMKNSSHALKLRNVIWHSHIILDSHYTALKKYKQKSFHQM